MGKTPEDFSQLIDYPQAFASGTYPLYSLMNHSCDPSVVYLKYNRRNNDRRDPASVEKRRATPCHVLRLLYQDTKSSSSSLIEREHNIFSAAALLLVSWIGLPLMTFVLDSPFFAALFAPKSFPNARKSQENLTSVY